MDQCKVNFAFERMGLNWTVLGGTVKEYDMDTEWYAVGDVKIYILSLRTICRQRFCVESAIGVYKQKCVCELWNLKPQSDVSRLNDYTTVN